MGIPSEEKGISSEFGEQRKENIYNILHLRLQRVRAYACVRGKIEKKKTHKEKILVG